MKVNVQRGIVFLELVEEEQVSAGGIVLPEASAAKSNVARITHIHPDTALGSELRVGQSVIVNPYSVREIELTGVTHLAVTVGDILATLEDHG